MLEERTIPPTPQRRAQARREGRQPRSADVTAVTVLACCLIAIWHFSHAQSPGLAGWLRGGLGATSHPPMDADQWVLQLRQTLLATAWFLVPAMVLLWWLAVATQLAQTGCHWLPHKLAPDWQRLSWARGGARVFSPYNLVDALFVLLRYAGLLALATLLLWQQREPLFLVAAQPLPAAAAATVRLAAQLLLDAALALAALAALDYAYRWWRHEKSLWMTSAEAREENRQQAGDGRVRELQHAAHGPAARARQAPPTQAAADSPP